MEPARAREGGSSFLPPLPPPSLSLSLSLSAAASFFKRGTRLFFLHRGSQRFAGFACRAGRRRVLKMSVSLRASRPRPSPSTGRGSARNERALYARVYARLSVIYEASDIFTAGSRLLRRWIHPAGCISDKSFPHSRESRVLSRRGDFYRALASASAPRIRRGRDPCFCPVLLAIPPHLRAYLDTV